ncbi:MAG: DUF1266 domain-containing protein [Lawsonibacter sp.]|nr:DUF1266 domain-containing protein [Lawsonibacter sp.]
MNFLRKNSLYIRIVITFLLAMVLQEKLLEGPAWTTYYNSMDLGPGSIGSPAQADTPVAHSIAEMEQLDRFRVERVQNDWNDHEGGSYLSSGYYWLLTLDSGEQIAMQYNLDGDEYDPMRNYWGSPIGVWRPWELTDQDRAILAREAPDLATTEYYADMQGNHEDAMDKEEFVEAYKYSVLFGFVVLLCLLQVLWGLFRRRQAEITRVRNDLELWLTGTYAIWAQFFAGWVLDNPEIAQNGPFYIGAIPRTRAFVKMMKKVLDDSWEITNYQELLETVEYMSEGPGYQHSEGDPASLAWELCRSMQLLGCAYMVGWCSREELIRRSCVVGRIMQKDFQSWEELCQGFLDGFSAWRLSGGQDPGDLAAVQQRADIYWAIRRRADSPYNLPWQMELKG